MVKFKFPGKPSKIVQRSLVSAYSIVVPTCDSSSVSEDVCNRLSLFYDAFGADEDGEESFAGFSREELDKAIVRRDNRKADLKTELISRGLCVPVVSVARIPETEYSRITSEPAEEPLQESNPFAQKKDRKKLWLSNKRVLNRYSKIQMRHKNFKSLHKSSLIRFKHKSLSANYLTDRYCRKFVLPTRSLHSSRVIKPTKRFIEHEKHMKSKFMTEDTDFAGDSSSEEVEKPVIPLNKVIIREARLNITTEAGITGPFSAKKIPSVDKEFRSGVVTCQICGSIRYYKYVLQTKKFGIYSCETCRRFVLKMIKYSKQTNKEALKCSAENGVGKCAILPVSNKKRDNCDLFSKNTRCEGCWLSICIQKYLLSSSIKKSLIQLLPEDMIENYDISDYKKLLPYSSDDTSAEIPISTQNEEVHEKLRKRLNGHTFSKSLRKRALEKHETRTKNFTHKRSAAANVKNKSPQELSSKEDQIDSGHYIPRGPRIKHVCRSASSVLKTSPSSQDLEDTSCSLSESEIPKPARRSFSNELKSVDKPVQLTRIRQCDDSSSNSMDFSADTDSSVKSSLQHYGARTLQQFGKESSDESDENEGKVICTDFWEAYDPDEVFKTGFPLICSEMLNVRALCFLCGSAGIEKLLYCVSCCEPYHWYCAEGPSAFRDESELEKCQVNWVCRKCKVCSTCGERDSRLLTSCQRCKNSFHTECLTNKALNKRLFKSDRPWVCPNCLKCKSCNSGSVFTHVGNIPLCSLCFKLRQKGSFCTLCQGCYQEDDYNVKMMECGVCNKWIHAKCEGLSHEKYQILSFLPDTIEFVCRLCCKSPPPEWWLAVEDELKAGYLGILKSLCKNKKVSDLFKESPKKEMCRCLSKRRTSSVSTTDSESRTDAEPEPKPIPAQSYLLRKPDDIGLSSPVIKPQDPPPSAINDLCSYCCYSTETRSKINQDLLSIKTKVHNNQYCSLASFHQELESVIVEVEELDLMKTYRDSLKKFFPWFDPDNMEEEDADEEGTVDISLTENGAPLVDSKLSNEATEEEHDNLRTLMATEEYSYESHRILDVRKCNLCKGLGEAVPSEGGRLIYCGRNEWVHSNCALWSSEVFEEIDGSLQNVHSAISRGRQIRCTVCDKKGASVGCCYKNCGQTYHFTCAKKASCLFLQNRTIYCASHEMREAATCLSNEKDFEILRPVYVETDRKKKRLECHANVKLRVGSLHVENLGKIDPHLSDNPRYILPIYFRCTRLFWSTTKPWKIIQYHIQIKLRYYYQSVKQDSEVNYTVAHSSERNEVNDMMKEIVNKVCLKEEYTQGGTDILSPELQEAIYKDFPNDFFNDKTIQEMWNSYEDTSVDGLGEDKVNSSRTTPENGNHAKYSKHRSVLKNGHCERSKTSQKDDKFNGKCLRDKNDFKEDGVKRNNTFDNFYTELCNKVKRKINFENTAVNGTKKKLYDDKYIGGKDYYGSTDRSYMQSYENILQLDGMVDISDEQPVKCVQCHRTYRTSSSFEKHLEICNADFNDYMSSGESDASSDEEKSTKYESPRKNVCEPVAQVQMPTEMMNANTMYTIASTRNESQAMCLQSVGENLKEVSVPMGKGPEIICTDYMSQFAISQNQQYQFQNVTPTYVMQELPKPSEVIPTYVTLGNNTIASADAILPQMQIQQLPQIATVSQPAMNFQQMIPTLLVQPSMPTYILNAQGPGAELYASPQGNLILQNQPMLLGMETVVSNTVMSSQFMTQSLAGNVGSSAMYSTTTTQVFQAAKQIPQSIPSGYIMVNQPIQQSTVQPVAPQPTVSTPEKYIYLQIPATQNLSPKNGQGGGKPIFRKAVKVESQTTKPVKVMHVKNNKPVSVQTKNNVVKLVPTNQTVVRVNGANKPVFNSAVANQAAKVVNSSPKVQQTISKVLLDKPSSVVRKVPNIYTDVTKTPQSIPVRTATQKVSVYTSTRPAEQSPLANPSQQAHVPVNVVHEKRSVCTNTDMGERSEANGHWKATSSVSVGTSVPHIPLPSAATCTPSNGKEKQTIEIRYTIDNMENVGQVNSFFKSWELNLPPTQVPKSADSQENVSSVAPECKEMPQEAPKRESAVLLSAKPKETKCPEPITSAVDAPPTKRADMPDISDLFGKTAPTPASTEDGKNESEQVFEELLRQHKLSMMSETANSLATPLSCNVIESPEPPKIKSYSVSKMKYKPSVQNVRKSNIVFDSETPKRTEAKTSAPNAAVKRKKTPEKENVQKAKGPVPPSPGTGSNGKSWRTPSISFEVNAEDGFSYKTNNLIDLWNKIIESVQKNRTKYKLPLLPKNALVNADSVYGMLGFENNASKYLLEQLPDAWKCIFYKPVFHKSQLQASRTSPMKNESGCARTEPFNSSHKYDMFGWLASRHRKPPKFMMLSDSDIVNGNRRGTSVNLPMAMRFRHLKETAKETVGVFRSDIHGRGLFCLRDIDSGEMVIEYAGEVIRSTLTDKRERYYTSKGIGCYMFRIDDKYVVDATMCGNAARFINHSCEPNCYSRIVDILGKKHILIFALRKIPKGEELTYDYKFPLEDDKISCHCLSRKCRKYLN